MTRMAAFMLVAALVTACGSSIPVKGNTTEVMSIAGHWVGEFKENDSERHGKVVFDLETGRHTGEGKVTAFNDLAETQSQTLEIKFLKVAGDAVTGTIAPYIEPRCNCKVKTEFSGALTEDAIIGSYVMASEDGAVERRGEWSATRVN